jgi:hypothetical protein
VALATDKSVFLHIPKCTGTLVRRAFEVSGIHTEELGEQHTHFPDLLKLRPPEFFRNRFLFSFVRHPLTWYQSRWAFRMKTGWRAHHPLDYHCASNDFRTFVSLALDYMPDGWFSWECRNYIDQAPRRLDFIGRTETAIDDVIKAFRFAGEKVAERKIRALARVNVSDLDGKPSSHWAKYTPELAAKVVAVESEVISRYYHDYGDAL